MKKIYTIIAMMLLLGGVYAQNLNNFVAPRQVHNANPNFRLGTNLEKNTVGPFWIQYDTSDFINQLNQGNQVDAYFLMLSNAAYTIADTTPIIHNHGDYYTYVMVSFDSLTDHTGGVNTTYPLNTATVAVDSFAFFASQMNASGTDDTLFFTFYQNVNGVPSNTVLQIDTIVIPAASPLQTAGAFDSGFFNTYVMPLTTPLMLAPFTTFSIKEEYHGSKADTFGYINADAYFNGSTTGCPSPFAFALKSTFFVNTYYHYGDIYAAWENTMWPNPSLATGHTTYIDPSGEFYWDCNGNGVYDAGEGVAYTQNAGIFAHVTLTTGIQENKALGIKLNQNVPNPFNNTTDITYQLAKRSGNVTLEITDLTGRVVTTINEGAKDSGKYTITLDSKNLSQGAYFYTLNVDGYRLTNKMIVTK